jgi:hypothetical protein
MPRSPGTGESGAGQDAQMPRSPGTGESGAGQDAQMPRSPGTGESGVSPILVLSCTRLRLTQQAAGLGARQIVWRINSNGGRNG